MRIQHQLALAGALCTIVLFGPMACSKGDSSDGTPQSAGPLPLKAGSILVSNTKLGTNAYSVSAAFYDATAAGSAGACTVEIYDNCNIQQCDISPAVDAGTLTGVVKEVSAGLISIQGGAMDVELSTAPSLTSYPALNKGGLLWSGGETITIDASGSPQGVGPFSASLTAPSFVELQLPKLDSGNIAVDRTKPLDLVWSSTGQAAGHVATTLRSLASNAKTVSATCQYPAGDGKGSIPATVLSKFPDGTGSLSASGLSETTLLVADWGITLSLVANGGNQGSANAANVAFR